MEVLTIQSVLIYNIENKNKVIGKLENVSKNDSLKSIRSKIKKMTESDEFVKPKNNGDSEIFDKDMEEEFSLEDILIKENDVYKLFIKISNYKNNNNTEIQNNSINQKKNNNVKINENNSTNQININFMKTYNVQFKVNNGINYSIPIIGRTKIKTLLSSYKKVYGCNFKNKKVQCLYNGLEINEFYDERTAANFFHTNFNPTIIVQDSYDLIGRLINITFKKNNGDKYEIIFNCKRYVYEIKEKFFNDMEIDDEGDKEKIQFLYKGKEIKFEQNNISIENFFANEKNPIIIVNDIYNLIDKKYKITFETNYGCKHLLTFNGSKTLEDCLESYLEEIDEVFIKEFKIEIKHKKQISFFYNGKEINFDIITIRNYFENDTNPKIIVNDINNLFLINWDENKIFVFKTNHGLINELTLNNTETVNEMLRRYFQLIGHEVLFRKDKIQFIYNGQLLQGDFNTTIGQFFLTESEIKFFVNDVYNLLLINWEQTKNITFIVNQGFKKELTLKNYYSLNYLLAQYLYIIDHQNLCYSNITYLYNTQKINFGDYTTIGEFFLCDNNPIILVIDINNLINPVFTTFKTTYGDIFQVIINPQKTLGDLLLKYLMEIFHYELIDRNDKIQFLYHAKRIKFEDKKNIGQFFLNDYNPQILVMDVNNLLSNKNLPKKNIVFSYIGKNCGMVVNHGTTLEQLFKVFLYKCDIQELLDNYYQNNDSLVFKYNAVNIDFKNQTFIENYFMDGLPRIDVSINNLVTNSIK